MERTILLVDGDLLALGRVESAARAAGRAVVTCTTDELPDRLDDNVHLAIVDLDRAGEPALKALEASDDSTRARVVAFYSHVDERLRTAAERAGVRAWPRGRLWRSLDDLLSA